MANSATNACATIGTDLAPTLVSSAYSIFQGFATDAFNLTHEQIANLQGFHFDFIRWNAGWTADGTLSGFQRPEKPELPPIVLPDISGQIPDAPTVNILPVVLDAAPVEPAYLLDPPNIDLTVNAPAPLDATRPGSAPVLVIPDVPDLPVLSFPDAPTLTPIVTPDAPTIVIPEFAELAPEFDAVPPSDFIDFTEGAYVSALMDKMRFRITAMLDGGTGLPAAIEQALYDRANDRDDASERRLVQETVEDFASRGFETEPNGILSRRIAQARQDNRNARANNNRDVTIRAMDVEVENLRFAVSTAANFEIQMLQAHLAVEERKFQYAVKVKDVQLAIFTAYVGRFNGIVAAYNARIEAYKAYLDGLKAKVDVYKAQIEAAKVEGEINEQYIREYEARIRAETAKAEAGRAALDAFRARIDAERAKIDGYRASVDAYGSFVEAYKAEWDAERTRLEAEASRGRLYESAVNGFAARVNVWRTKGDVKIEEHRANLTSAQAMLQQQDAQVRTVLARLEILRTSLTAQTAQGEQATRLFEAEARVEGIAVDVDNRSFALDTERERARIEALLNDSRLQIEQLSSVTGLMLRAMESAAQTSSQLAAASMSAINFSAGLSSSNSRSSNCSTNFNYNGEVSDAL